MFKPFSRTARKLLALSLIAAGLAGGLFALQSYQGNLADVIFARGKVKAALTGVTLNNGNSNLIIGSDITSQTTALSPDTGAYRWTRDGTALMALNMPFHTGSPQTDFSGLGSSGTVSGPTFTSGCQVGTCFDFDGTNDQIELTTFPNVYTFNTPFTISAWIKPGTLVDRTIVSNWRNASIGGVSNHGVFFELDSNGKPRCSYRNNGVSVFDFEIDVLLPTDVWAHMVCVYDPSLGSENARIFINGVLQVGGGTVNATSLFSITGRSLRIGTLTAGLDSGFSRFFDGNIDEVQIYSRSLASGQILSLYNDGLAGVAGPTVIKSAETANGQYWNLFVTPISSSGVVGSAIQSSNPVAITSGISGITGSLNSPDEGSPIISTLTIPGGSTAGYRWLVDGANLMAVDMPFNTGATQAEISGNGNVATVTGATFTTANCKVGGCLSFDGTDDLVDIPAKIWGFSTTGTMEAWIKTTDNTAAIMSLGRATITDEMLLYIMNNKICIFNHKSNANYIAKCSNTTVNDNVFHHVVGMLTGGGTFADMRIFVDGAEEAGTQSTLGTSSPIVDTTARNLRLANRNSSTTGVETYAGIIDEARIYPRALSAAQVKQNYQDGQAGLGGPIRISAQEHALNQVWDLLGTEFLSDGTTGPVINIGRATISAAAATSVGITTPAGTQEGFITINYSCANPNSHLRDFLVEFSTNGGGSFAAATLVSVSSGSIAGSLISMAACASGTSNNSFVWNSLAGVTTSSTVQIRITPSYPGATGATTSDFTVTNPVNLCTAGGEAAGGLTAAETSFDGMSVSIINCTLSIDGVHSFSSFTLGDAVGTSDSVLTHSETTNTTIFKVDITSTGNITINSDGLVNADGRGFLGGNRTVGSSNLGRTTGNTTATGSASNSSGSGNGGAHGGRGGLNGGTWGTTYGDLTNPVEPGAGGGARDTSNTACDGGGLLRFTATGSLTLNGTINARGEQSCATNGGGGAGGGVYLSSATFAGSGTVRANGGQAGGSFTGGGGGGGRVAVHYTTNNFTGTLQAIGGDWKTGSAGGYGGAGTVFLKSTASSTGDLIIENNNNIPATDSTTLPATPTAFKNITLSNASRAYSTALAQIEQTFSINNATFTHASASSGTITADTITLSNGSIMSHENTTTTFIYKLDVVAATMTIDATSNINSDGRGFLGANKGANTGVATGRTTGNTTTGGSTNNVGGSHGGLGGRPANVVAVTYDSITNPVEPGGGSGSRDTSNTGRNGGGVIHLNISGTLTVNGAIRSDGEASGGSNGGGGAGGSLKITAGTLAGNGTLRTVGGNGIGLNGDATGGGGGGRMAIYYTTNTFTGTMLANGGLKANAGLDASAGTIYLKSAAQTNGDLIVDNNNVVAIISGTTLPVSPNTYDNVTIRNRGRAMYTQLQANATPWTIGTLNLETNSDLTSAESDNSNVYKLNFALTNLNIDATSTITTDGRGYFGAGPSKSGTASGKTLGNVAGSANNVGGSHGGLGGRTPVAATYDSLVDPVEAGGGGGSRDTSNTGRDGGGIIKIVASGTMAIQGVISSDGEQTGGSNGGGGAGGTVNVTVGTLTGSGSIRANGSNGIGLNADATGGGGGGRVAIYYTTNNFAGTIIAAGGVKANAGEDAGAGTVYLKHPSQTNGDLLIDNNNRAPLIGTTTMPNSPRVFDNTTIRNGARLKLTALVADATPWSFGALTMQTNSDITSEETDLTNVYRLYVTAASATIDATSSFNVDGRGFLGGNRLAASSNIGRTTGNSTTNGSTGGDGNGSGGSHGGRGGNSASTISGIAYDSLSAPVEPGGGGGARDSSNIGSDGGGIIRFNVDGLLTLNGTLSAKGVNSGGNGGGGAGGSVYVTAGILSGSGTMTVQGGNATTSFAPGGGAGGRIAVHYGTNTFTGTLVTQGGPGDDAGQHGGSGTAFLKDNAQSVGTLRLNNASQTTTAFTPLFVTGQPTTYTFVDLFVINLAKLVIDTPCAGTPALTVNGTTDLSGGGTITNNQSGTCTVTQGAISITTTTLPAAIINAAYSQQIQSSGGYAPHTFVCRNGGVTVACTTVLPAGLDMSSTGVVSGTPTVVGTTVFTVRATESAPGSGFDEETVSITVGNAPTAPTNLFSNSSDAQACCSSPTTDATPVFSAIFNDADAGNTSAKFRLQVASDVGFTTLLWDSGAAGTAMSSCAIGARCQNINYAGSALSLGGVTYHWRIKYWDNTNLEGPFSAGATFTTSQAPTAPTNLFSNDSSAQTGLTNPVGVVSGRPVFSARYNDPDIGDIANKYRIQVDDNSNFSSPVWDSGAAGTSMSNCTAGLRCADITFGGTTDLARDEKTYFWRIKFFDAAGVESPWSEDPIATNKFTMGLASSNIQQQVVVQNTVPNTPRASSVQVIDSTTLRYNWVDLSNNETGFRLIDDQGNVIKEVAAGVTSAEETGLPPNTAVSGRRVVAFNSAGVSQPSEPFTTTVTAMPIIRPVVVRRGANSVTFTVTPAPENLSQGTTGILFELIVRPSNPTQPIRTLTSDWQQVSEYTFTGLNPDDEVEVRVITRNQTGYANQPTEYVEVDELSRHFTVNLHVVKRGTNQLPRPLSPLDTIIVAVRIKNTGSEPATNVFASMQIPQYIRYRFGTLSVDNRTATDIIDEDVAHTTDRDVSAIWPRMAPGEEHTMSFDLVFDQAALLRLKSAAVASANPLIPLQVTVGFTESDAIFSSPVVILEPDLALAVEPPPGEDPQTIPEEPVPAPTQEDVDEVSEVLNGFIQEEAGQGQPTPSSPSGETEQTSGPQTQTTTSSDGPSFNIDVTRTDGNTLSVTGYAQPDQDQIEFSGTTSQPNALVTLIFNGNVTVLVTSDENGNWRTFVSADQLGIQPGQRAEVTIEAIAAKGDLRSDRVQVGRVTVGLESTGDIAAEFESTVSAAPIVTVINEVRKQVAIAIENQEPAIQRTLATAAPVVVISSAPLWGYLPYLPTMIYHAITYLVGLLGRKKKQQQRFFGVVYDSISKQPLALAIIRIYNKETNKLVATQVSDKQGRYEALLEPAAYRLEVTKPAYTFPSAIVTSEIDGNFQHIYRNEQGLQVQTEDITVPDVPLDPVNAEQQWQATHGLKKVWFAVQKAGNYLAVPVLIIGAVASLAVVATIPENPMNWLLAFVYVFMLGAQIKLRPKLQKAWGVVYDIASNAVLPLATIQLIDPQYGKVVTSRLTDYQGRYSFLPEPGQYVIKASKPGYEQIKEVVEAPQGEHKPIPEQVSVDKDQRITGDVAMKHVI